MMIGRSSVRNWTMARLVVEIVELDRNMAELPLTYIYDHLKPYI